MDGIDLKSLGQIFWLFFRFYGKFMANKEIKNRNRLINK
jgi:hypothetical protein